MVLHISPDMFGVGCVGRGLLCTMPGKQGGLVSVFEFNGGNHGKGGEKKIMKVSEF